MKMKMIIMSVSMARFQEAAVTNPDPIRFLICDHRAFYGAALDATDAKEETDHNFSRLGAMPALAIFSHGNL